MLFLSFAASMQAQCTVNIAASTTLGCAPFQIMLSCPAINSGTLHWAAGNFTATGNSAAFTFATPGDYSVSLTASIVSSPSQSCTASATLAIKVVSGPDNGCNSTIAGMEETDNMPYLEIFPNPCQGSFNVKTDYHLSDASYRICNGRGEKVMENTFKSGQTYINASTLSKGLYTVCIYKEGNCLGRKKLIIE